MTPPDLQTMTLTTPREGVALLTLNRPDRLNAISIQLLNEFGAVLHWLQEASDARVLILTGAGPGFCSGTDLKEARERHGGQRVGVEQGMATQQKLARLILGLRRIPQPVIAAVNGVAAGGGFCFTLAADIRIAAQSARFVASFINIGLSAGEIGSTYLLPRLVGVSRAADILYTGREVGAAEAERIGLVSRVVDDGQAVSAALEVAEVMLAKTPFGLRMTKEVLDINIDAPSLESALQLENRTQQLAVQSDGFKQAVERFNQRPTRSR